MGLVRTYYSVPREALFACAEALLFAGSFCERNDRLHEDARAKGKVGDNESEIWTKNSSLHSTPRFMRSVTKGQCCYYSSCRPTGGDINGAFAGAQSRVNTQCN